VICGSPASGLSGPPLCRLHWLLTRAEEIEEIKTICACGKKATMHIRINADGSRVVQGPQVEIGGEARYRAVCSRCFHQG
jgi:thymidine kinase